MLPLRDENPTEITPYITFLFIGICTCVFLWQFGLNHTDAEIAVKSWGMTPSKLFNGTPALAEGPPAVFTLLSSMFLHGGILHFLGNMLFLWIYGNNIEDAMGHFKFFLFYLLCGTAAGFLQALVQPNSTIPMIGASGAVSGILGAYFLLYPRARVSTLVFLGFFITIFRIPAGLLIGGWFCMQVFSAYYSDPNLPGVAWYAHIGGFIAGIFLLPFLKNKNVPYFNTSNMYVPEHKTKTDSKRNSLSIRFRKRN